MELKYFTLCTRNIDSEIDFCTGKLGFRVFKHTKILNQRQCTILVKDNSDKALMLIESDDKNKAGSTVILNTDDFLKDHFELKGVGVNFLSEPEYTMAGIAAAFEDPDGNRWVLIEERDYSAN